MQSGGQADEVTLGPEGTATSLPEVDAPVAIGDRVGRYVITSRIGDGGMGVVFAAVDAELDRKIALKVLRPDRRRTGAGAEHRTRLVREAKALAKINHPNVVAIYDVGSLGEHMWIAMELVEGTTLDRWASTRRPGWREVLVAMEGARAGLAAAHAAGLLHRDFKPQNVMITERGRTVVTDFGLALDRTALSDPSHGEGPEPSDSRVTRVGRVVGTPAYMSPEQLLGDDLDARSDQFSFCVTLWELLYRERPYAGDTPSERALAVLQGGLHAPSDERDTPRWLRRICERGLSAVRADRFADMDALGAAIAGGRSRVRNRRVAIAAAVVAVAGAGVLGARAHVHRRGVAACEASGEALAASWNDAARAALVERARAAGARHPERTAGSTIVPLDAYVDAWRSSQVAACVAIEVDRAWETTRGERARYCLDDARLVLEGLTEELATADLAELREAPMSVAGLAPPARCLDEQNLARVALPTSKEGGESTVEIRRDLSRVRGSEMLGRYDHALELATALLERAAASSPRLEAETQLVIAGLQTERSRLAEAEAAGLAAYTIAAKAGAWDIAAQAAEELATSVGLRAARYAEGRTWMAHADVAVAYAGDPFRAREARRANILGRIALATGELERAEALLRESRDLMVEIDGPDSWGVGASTGSLARIAYQRGDPHGAIATMQQAIDITQRALGEDHPQLIGFVSNLAMLHVTASQYDEADRVATRAMALAQTHLGEEHPAIAANLDTLAKVADQRGQPQVAIEHYRRSLALQEKVLGEAHPNIGVAATNLGGALLATDPAASVRLLERAVAIKHKALGAEHIDVAPSLRVLGDARRATGDLAGAIAEYERALVIVDAAPGQQVTEPPLRFALAQALALRGDGPSRILALATEAAAGYRAHGAEVEAADIDAWIAARARPPGGSPAPAATP